MASATKQNSGIASRSSASAATMSNARFEATAATPSSRRRRRTARGAQVGHREPPQHPLAEAERVVDEAAIESTAHEPFGESGARVLVRGEHDEVRPIPCRNHVNWLSSPDLGSAHVPTTSKAPLVLRRAVSSPRAPGPSPTNSSRLGRATIGRPATPQGDAHGERAARPRQQPPRRPPVGVVIRKIAAIPARASAAAPAALSNLAPRPRSPRAIRKS